MVRVAGNMTRKSLALLTSLLLVLFWVPGLLAPSASADSGSSIPSSPYNGGDGTIPDSNTSIHTATDPVGNVDTTSFTGGKEDDQCPGVTTQGLSSPKDDLSTLYVGSEQVSSQVFLYLAWVRSTTNGTTTIDFELNQASGAMSQCNGVNPERISGDLLFTYDFSNGGGNVDINYYVWDSTLNSGDGAWVAKGDITGLTHNGDPVVEAQTDNTGIKGEMAVNLSLLPGVFTADTCKDFGTAWGKTRSSTSFGSEIKDYVTPQPTVISNCAPLEILKEDSGTTPKAGAVFSIVANSGTHVVPAGQSPCTTQADGFCRVEIPNTTPQAYAFPLLFPGSYHVTETTAPPGYLLPTPKAWDVSVPQNLDSNGNVVPLTVHDPLGSITFAKVDDVTGLPLGGATFHIAPNPLPGGSGSFLSVTDTTNGTGGDSAHAAGTITVSGAMVGHYTITESAPPAGYVASTASLTADVVDPQLHPGGTADPDLTATPFRDPTVPSITAVKSSDPASGTAADPAPVSPGQTISYTVTLSNSGSSAATGVTVTDAIPTGTTYVDGSADQGGTLSGGTLTWTVDVPGATSSPGTVSLHFQVTVDAGDVNGTLIDNTAAFSDVNTSGCVAAGAGMCSTNTTHHKVVFPIIGAVKSSDPASGTAADPTPVTPGQTISYTIAVSNTGLADATGVAVSDAIPAGTTYVAGSADNGGTLGGGSLSWTIDVAAQSTVNLHFHVTVDGSDANGTLIDNTATVNGSSTNTTHHEVEFAVLSLAKSSNPVSGSLVQRGDRIDYTVTLTNSGLAASDPTTVTDTLPDHVTVVAGSASPAFTTVNGNVVTWTVTVAAGATQALTYSVTVDSDAPEGATLTNVALVGGQCLGSADESACTTDHHVPTGALTLVKHVNKSTAHYGDTLTYTFDAATTGALNQTNVTVTDVLPKDTTYVNGSAGCTDAGTCTASFTGSTRTVTWQLGAMAAGTTRHLVFKVTINTPTFDPSAGLPPKTILNSGVIASTETASTPSNVVKTTVVAVLGVKVIRKPRLPFTGAPAQAMATVALLMLGAGVALTTVRRRKEN